MLHGYTVSYLTTMVYRVPCYRVTVLQYLHMLHCHTMYFLVTDYSFCNISVTTRGPVGGTKRIKPKSLNAHPFFSYLLRSTDTRIHQKPATYVTVFVHFSFPSFFPPTKKERKKERKKNSEIQQNLNRRRNKIIVILNTPPGKISFI